MNELEQDIQRAMQDPKVAEVQQRWGAHFGTMSPMLALILLDMKARRVEAV